MYLQLRWPPLRPLNCRPKVELSETFSRSALRFLFPLRLANHRASPSLVSRPAFVLGLISLVCTGFFFAAVGCRYRHRRNLPSTIKNRGSRRNYAQERAVAQMNPDDTRIDNPRVSRFDWTIVSISKTLRCLL